MVDQTEKVLAERALLLQTLGRKLFVRLKFDYVGDIRIHPGNTETLNAGEFLEVLNWCERTGMLFVKLRDGKKIWLSGERFEEIECR